MLRLVLLLLSGSLCCPALAETRWRIETAPKYDAACVIGTLAGDSFYTRYYEDELKELRALLSDETFEAAARGYQVFREAEVLAGPWLALAWAVLDGDTLQDAIAATADPQAMRARLHTSDYWDERQWEIFERARPALLTMLEGLEKEGFRDWWRQAAETPSRRRARELAPRLAGIDVVPLIEKSVGRELPSHEITLVAARLCRPHGIRVTGARFLLDIVDSSDPLPIAVATAVHEMIHPPFDAKDERIVRLANVLRQDAFVYGRWQSHDPAFGYNTFEGYLDEDVTKALDQIIGERIGMTFTSDPVQRWVSNDEGMHVLAAAVYELLKEEKFLDGNEDATEFLDRMVREERLVPGRIEPLVPERVRLAGEATP
jgi:hypothetical protein